MKVICPHCQTEFELTDAGYQDLLSQVKTKEFAKELEEKLATYKEKEEAKKKLDEADALAKFNQEKNALEKRIQELNAQLQGADAAKQLALSEQKASASEDLDKKKAEINELKLTLEKSKIEAQAAIDKATATLTNEVKELRNQLSLAAKDKQLELTNQKNAFETTLKMKEEEIDRLKDFRLKESTKMVGENLEQYCHDEFDKLRAVAFPSAYFEKDNDAKTGSKGDFIFRDYDDEGNEYVSIMFEMKNEMDATATKHKNADFFKELDKDRNEKKCEYAVLVSMLEQDSNLYNQGIVDVSHLYPKMYVIRPQFFIPLISLLKNAAQNSIGLKKQLIAMKNQNLELETFEDNLQAFKDGFSRNFELAKKKYDSAIEQIDKSIAALTKVKEALMGSERNLSIANNKIDDVTIRKLTKGAPTIAAKLEEIQEEKKQNSL